MTTKRARGSSLPVDLTFPAIVVLAIVPLLFWSGASTRHAIADASAFQQRVREAQMLRSRVLQSQLDEETGLRGFTSTGDRLFLEPYTRAYRSFPSTIAKARAAAASAGVDPSPIDDERALHDRWVDAVATPLLRNPRDPRQVQLQAAGKIDVDGMRADDDAMRVALDSAAADSAAQLQSAVRRVSDTTIYASVSVVGLAVGLGYVRFRAMRRIAQERERYHTEKRIADSLQDAFLQQDLPVSPHVGLHAAYIPAEDTARVGGDWYDAFELPDGRLLVSIGDVAGHGLTAAIAMSRARQAIIVAALHENDPAIVLERANKAIVLQDGPMVTAICGYVDLRTMRIVYATAGHPSPIMRRGDGATALLPVDGIALGVDPGATYRAFEAQAENGALLVLYTDGVIELDRDPIDGEAKLRAAVAASGGMTNPALAIQQRMFATTAPRDDVAILTLSFRGAGGGRGRATLAAAQAPQLDVRAS